MASTGVAAHNVDGKTLHSLLKIHFNDNHYETLIHSNTDNESNLKKINYIIIEEISMLNGDLFTFTSNIFSTLHNNNLIFGGILTLLVGNLAQLPSIKPKYIFQSLVWLPFFLLFLTLPQRQYDDHDFYNILQEIHIGRLSNRSLTILQSKINLTNDLTQFYNTTHIVDIRYEAQDINCLLCTYLPLDHTTSKPLISLSKDTFDFEILNHNHFFL
ncbi:10294_t:CDS:1 [Ambispora leptoticha]|uniref:ATP-dependent DNA helicase n=1 Tax=Ambispora leptoticha TaxID=144679 RepID=A0A9N9DK24_9GLOM|nr:10294_t:CDS:1 [Ambispora leptoticha]